MILGLIFSLLAKVLSFVIINQRRNVKGEKA